MNTETSKGRDEGYDFTEKDPGEALTEDENEHFEEGMKLKNTSLPASKIDFERGAKSAALEFDDMLSSLHEKVNCV
jgi:hypothetical protein